MNLGVRDFHKVPSLQYFVIGYTGRVLTERYLLSNAITCDKQTCGVLKTITITLTHTGLNSPDILTYPLRHISVELDHPQEKC
jgi:hypothetical protein